MILPAFPAFPSMPRIYVKKLDFLLLALVRRRVLVITGPNRGIDQAHGALGVGTECHARTDFGERGRRFVEVEWDISTQQANG